MQYVDASLTTIDGAHTVDDTTVDVVDASEFSAPGIIKVWDKDDAKILKAVISFTGISTNQLTGCVWDYGGHTDVNLDAGDFVAQEIPAKIYAEQFRLNPLEGPAAYTDAGMSDEFDSGTLDAQWTVAGATSGTVSMVTANPADSVYDLTSLPGTLLVMIKPAEMVTFRVDDFLADGEQVIVAMGYSFPGEASAQQNNAMHVGVGFNDNDTDKGAGNDVQWLWDGAEDHRMFVANTDQGTVTGIIPHSTGIGHRVYFRLARDSGSVHFWHSMDGIVWTSLNSSSTHVSTANNFWIFMGSTSATALHANIVAVHWVRHVANTSYLPW